MQKKYQTIFKIVGAISIFAICALGLSGLYNKDTAPINAAPVIDTGTVDGSGSWTDSFEDNLGITSSDNIEVASGEVGIKDKSVATAITWEDSFGATLGPAWTTYSSPTGYNWATMQTTDHNNVTSYVARSSTSLPYNTSGLNYSSIERTVSGPATISFWWKVYATQYDAFQLLVDGNVINSINGSTAWQQIIYGIESGSHTLTWKFKKYRSGSYVGYLDDVKVYNKGVESLGWNTYSSPAAGFTWGAIQYDKYTGSWSARSANALPYASPNNSSYIERQANFPDQAVLSFYWRAYAGSNDSLKFLVDGVQIYSISGSPAWEQKTYAIPSGTHTITWKYTRGSTSPVGDNAGYLDQVIISGPGIVDWITNSSPNLNYTWGPTQNSKHSGSWSARSSTDLPQNNVSYIKRTIDGPATLSFWWRISAGSADRVKLFIDSTASQPIYAINGPDTSWQQIYYNVPSGPHEIIWQYERYSLTKTNDNAGYLDDIQIYNKGVESSDWTTGSSPNPNFTFSSNPSQYHTGSFSARNANQLPLDNTSYIQRGVNGPNTVAFWWKISGTSYDYLRVLVDNEQKEILTTDETLAWQYITLPITTGSHVVRWEFKQGTSPPGNSAGYLDDVQILLDNSFFDSFEDIGNIFIDEGFEGTSLYNLFTDGFEMDLVPAQGWLISNPIEPDGLINWVNIFADQLKPALTNIVFSLLNNNLAPISGFSDITPSTDLSGIIREDYNSVYLKASLSTQDPVQTPALQTWGISFEADPDDPFVDISYNPDPVYSSNEITFSSLAADNYSYLGNFIKEHKIKWWIQGDWHLDPNMGGASCSFNGDPGYIDYTYCQKVWNDTGGINSVTIGPLPGNTEVIYQAYAMDYNYNVSVTEPSSLTIQGNPPPTASNLQITQGNYCSIPSHNFSWDYSGASAQSKFKIQADTSQSFDTAALVDIEYSSVNENTSILAQSNPLPGSDALNYSTTYYWRIKVWDNADPALESEWFQYPGTFITDPQYPIVDFTWSPEKPIINESATFNSGGTSFPAGPAPSPWLWDFPDDIPDSTDPNPAVTFTVKNPSTKDVTLSATDSNDHTCSVTKQVRTKAKPKWREILPW
ncbi:MAG: PKD domain-containing protein [Candidatus Portnoybacteria bacterium]|nr:PKD domain-containing protein [Candidatus Portnoybacteria bacterium]